MDIYVGTVSIFAFDYAPAGWMQCQGQTLQVAQNSALFSVIGNRYGGDGVTTFMLPNMGGRMPVGVGPAQPASGLPGYNVGDSGGQQNVTLAVANLPPHSHGSAGLAVGFQATGTPTPAVPAAGPSSSNPCLGASGPGTGLATIWSAALSNPVNIKGMTLTGTTDPTGGGAPLGVLNPFLAFNFCIAVQGTLPPRS